MFFYSLFKNKVYQFFYSDRHRKARHISVWVIMSLSVVGMFACSGDSMPHWMYDIPALRFVFCYDNQLLFTISSSFITSAIVFFLLQSMPENRKKNRSITVLLKMIGFIAESYQVNPFAWSKNFYHFKWYDAKELYTALCSLEKELLKNKNDDYAYVKSKTSIECCNQIHQFFFNHISTALSIDNKALDLWSGMASSVKNISDMHSKLDSQRLQDIIEEYNLYMGEFINISLKFIKEYNNEALAPSINH